MKKILLHPLYMIAIMLLGVSLCIEIAHYQYHRDADLDAHGHVKRWCKGSDLSRKKCTWWGAPD